MKLKVNRKNITVFEGAEVRHAVLSYLALKGMDVSLADSLTVYDRWGHDRGRCDEDGSISERCCGGILHRKGTGRHAHLMLQ